MSPSLPTRVPREQPVVGQNIGRHAGRGSPAKRACVAMSLLLALLGTLRAALKARTDLVLENLALRQQLALLRRRSKRPPVGLLDRVFWMWLSQWWARWREALHVVQPQTMIRWHRQGFRAFWNWKSRRGRTGRPPVDLEVVEAFPHDSAPRFLIRDRDGIFGGQFRQRVKAIGLAEVLITPRSPWQNPFAERVIGTIRRELLDHVIVLKERHLRRRLRNYLGYYHASRTHLALGKDAPEPRPVEPPERGDVVAVPQAGGLHHRYIRCAA